MTLLESLRRWFEKGSAWNTARGTLCERESPRYNITILARYGGEGPLTERRGNIGIGGFCFEGERELSPGTVVAVSFKLPGTNHWIRARGNVLGHVRHTGWLGVRGRFTELTFEDERLLARWLDSMTQDLGAAAQKRPSLLTVSY